MTSSPEWSPAQGRTHAAPELRAGSIRWIWVGPVVAEDATTLPPGISLAAQRWQKGLIGALARAGDRVSVLSFIPSRAWPRGRLAIRGANLSIFPELGDGVVVTQRGYPNLPGIRASYRSLLDGQRLLRWICSSDSRPVLLTYGPSWENTFYGLAGSAVGNALWIRILADLTDALASDAEEGTPQRIADGDILLSHSAFARWNRPSKLLLDGGVDERCLHVDEPSRQVGNRALLYSGGLNRMAGLVKVIAAFKKGAPADSELWLCGFGDDGTARSAAASDPRVMLKGLVDEASFQTLQRRCLGFIMARAESQKRAQYSFPSKVFEYLRYGKPVACEWVGGFAPEYSDVLFASRGESVDELAAQVSRIFKQTPEQLFDYRQRCHEFLSGGRLWSQQASALRGWVISLMSPSLTGDVTR